MGGLAVYKRAENENTLHSLLRAIYLFFKGIFCRASYIGYYLRKPRLETRTAKDGEPKVIVSFTTYPARLKYLPITVGSLVRQTMQPDKIILYLSREQFQNTDNPILRSIEKQGVEIALREGDMKSHKKYLYAMREYPEDIIITVDDDIIYDKMMIKDLYESYLRHPCAVSARRAHRMTFEENKKVKPYNEWDYNVNDNGDTESKELVATGCGGVLYPPMALSERFCDTEAIEKTCLSADDLWLKVMALMNGRGVVPIPDAPKLRPIWGSQFGGLAKKNVVECLNDVSLKKICDYFNINLYNLVYGGAK